MSICVNISYVNRYLTFNIKRSNVFLRLAKTKDNRIQFNREIMHQAATEAIAKPANNRIVWMDLEMTGLNVQKDKIIEISCVITDDKLNLIAEAPDIAINYPKDIFNNIEVKYVQNLHTSSGLIEKCLKSQINLESAEQIVLNFLKQHVAEKSCPLAGNTVYMDRFFLAFHMPLIHEYLHYRIIDVSTIKELARRWNLPIFQSAPLKSRRHRSLIDIKESIEEMKHYRKHFFKITDATTGESDNNILSTTMNN